MSEIPGMGWSHPTNPAWLSRLDATAGLEYDFVPQRHHAGGWRPLRRKP